MKPSWTKADVIALGFGIFTVILLGINFMILFTLLIFYLSARA